MSVNRDEAARIIADGLKVGDETYEMAKILLMFEISDSLSDIAKELRKLTTKP